MSVKTVDIVLLLLLICFIIVMTILINYKKTADDACREHGMQYQSNSDVIGKGFCYYPDENGNIVFKPVPPYSRWK